MHSSFAFLCPKPSKPLCSDLCFLGSILCDLFYSNLLETTLFLLYYSSFPQTLVAAPCSSSDGCKNNKLSLLIVFLEVFATEQRAAKFELSSLNMETFRRWTVFSKTAQSRNTAEALDAKMRGRKKEKFCSISAITGPLLLEEADTEQARQILRASSALKTYVASDVRVQKCSFRLFREKRGCCLFSTAARFCRALLRRKKRPQKPHFRSVFRPGQRLGFFFKKPCT